jgi:arginase family enzyme
MARDAPRSPCPRPSDLFVSFDLDVLDAAHAPGVSAINPAGWTCARPKPGWRACGADPRVRCFDLMELNPAHDPDGRTARVAAHLFLSFLQGFARNDDAAHPQRPHPQPLIRRAS